MYFRSVCIRVYFTEAHVFTVLTWLLLCILYQFVCFFRMCLQFTCIIFSFFLMCIDTYFILKLILHPWARGPDTFHGRTG